MIPINCVRLDNITDLHPVRSGLNPNQHNRGKSIRRARADRKERKTSDNPVRIIIRVNMKEDSRKDKGENRAAKR